MGRNRAINSVLRQMASRETLLDVVVVLDIHAYCMSNFTGTVRFSNYEIMIKVTKYYWTPLLH